jgi:hypothetical protein
LEVGDLGFRLNVAGAIGGLPISSAAASLESSKESARELMPIAPEFSRCRLE